MAWPLRRLPVVSLLINTTWNPRGSFRLFPWCRWPFAELPLSNKAPRIHSLSLSLSLFLSGSVELSGSREQNRLLLFRQEDARKQTRLDGGRDITAATEKARTTTNFPAFTRRRHWLPAVWAERKKSEFLLNEGRKKYFPCTCCEVSPRPFIQLKASGTNRAICLFLYSNFFTLHLFFFCLPGSHARENQIINVVVAQHISRTYILCFCFKRNRRDRRAERTSSTISSSPGRQKWQRRY